MWKKTVTGLAVVGAGVLVVSALYAAEQGRNRLEPAVQLAQAPPRPEPAPPRPEPAPRRPAPAPRRPARPVEPPSIIEPGEGNQRTRVQLEMFQLTCSDKQLLDIDMDSLSGMRPGAVAQALAEYGNVQVVARLDDQLDLRGRLSLKLGSRVPIVREVGVSAKGAVTPSISYEDVGTLLEVRGAWTNTQEGDDWADLGLSVEASLIGRGPSIPVGAEGATLPTFNQLRLQKMLKLRSGQPGLMLVSQQAHAGDGERTSVLFVHLTVTRLSG